MTATAATPVRLDDLRTEALRHVAAGDFPRALRVQARILAAFPHDLEARMRVGDICVRLGQLDLARAVYAAVAYLDIQAGRPLHALVAMRALTDLGEEVAPLAEALARLYCAGSPRVARVGARLAPPAGDSEVEGPGEARSRAPRPGGDGDRELGAALGEALALASDAGGIKEFPTRFQPVPLLSELSEAALLRVLGCATVHRAVHGATLIRQGDPGDAFYFVASGAVRIHRRDEAGGSRELARLYEGAIFGEMALIQAEPRSASVEVVGAADVIAFGADAIRAAADELPALASALERFTRDRLARNAAFSSPLFAPFSPSEKMELLGRFRLRELPPGPVWQRGDEVADLLLVASGELTLLSSTPPFDQVVARVRPGDCVGEAELLGGRPATCGLRAERQTLVLSLSADYFHRLVMTVPEVKQFLEDRAAARADEGELLI